MKISRRTLIGTSIAATTAAAIAPARAASNVLRIAIGSSLNNLDPMMTTIGDEYIYDNLAFNGLTRMREDLVVEPDLAESWKFSDDIKTWTFKLRKGVKSPPRLEMKKTTQRVLQSPARSGKYWCARTQPVRHGRGRRRTGCVDRRLQAQHPGRRRCRPPDRPPGQDHRARGAAATMATKPILAPGPSSS